MAETELERAERKFNAAKARLQALKNREATRQRKLDTRRKVILGGALVDLAERDDGALAMVERLLRNLSREADRRAFDGWELRGVGEAEVRASGEAGSGARDDGAGVGVGDSRSDEGMGPAGADDAAAEGSSARTEGPEAPGADAGSSRGIRTPSADAPSHQEIRDRLRKGEP